METDPHLQLEHQLILSRPKLEQIVPLVDIVTFTSLGVRSQNMPLALKFALQSHTYGSDVQSGQFLFVVPLVTLALLPHWSLIIVVY